MRSRGNKLFFYNQEQLINISKTQTIVKLQPQIPDELKRRHHGHRVGAKRTSPQLLQELLDKLDPLTDCHHSNIWAQVEVPQPVGSSGGPPSVSSLVASIEEPKEPLAMLMPFSVSGPVASQLHQVINQTSLCGHKFVALQPQSG
ncbi:hypothetical protein ATANTOWER_032655 [Ataeniobius toweri]|uniref:Uncharacterized protein n=1 Tax=Ataeniobius toweri TaxID=208326 RepID=A0ABU7AV46_9TELE|nr:hypothetical protein [Ataeniobius toweri]